MAQFRRGKEAVAQAAKRKGGGKFAPIFSWKAEETKYIQFLQPMETIPTVLMHQFIIVGTREDGNPKFERFISRRDPGLDGPDGYDDIIDRFGVMPTERSIALAVEMEPIFAAGGGARRKIEGFDVAMRQFEKDGETVEVPAIQLVIESPKTFFNHLGAQDDLTPIETVVWAVKRNGGGTDTTYTFMNTNEEALDVEEELETFTKETLDFEAWLEELADEDRMRELIEPLPSSHRISRYGGKKKDEDEQEAKPSRRPRRAARAAAEEAEDEAAEPEQADEDVKPKAGERSKRFSELRDTVKR